MSVYLTRTIEKILPKASSGFKIVLVNGMHGVGKSILLKRLGGKRRYVTLEDDKCLTAARSDPQTFIECIKTPAAIDAMELAPELYLPLKVSVDSSDADGRFWLASAHRLVLQTDVPDRLPGRLAPFDLLPLSIYERNGRGLEQTPFLPEIHRLARKSPFPCSETETWKTIWQGAWPGVIDADETQREQFYKSLVASYISREVLELAGIAKTDAFKRFLRALALLSGRELRYNTLCKLTGTTIATIRRWLSMAEMTGLIYLLPPFYGDVGRQLVKSPKMYLIDTGLIAYLLGIDSPLAFAEHPLADKFFETFVVMEILKSWRHNGRRADFYFFRESQGMEIDLLIQDGDVFHPVAITTSTYPRQTDAKWILKLKDLNVKVGTASVVSMAPEPYAVAPDVFVHNVWNL